MAKTSRDARRHMEGLSRFFSGENGVSNAVFREYLKKSEQKKYLKQSLRRLIAKGFITEDSRGYTPTLKGTRFFRRFLKKNGDKSELPNEWDKKWRLVTFDVPCKENLKRCQIRSLLKEFDFYQLQKSVWVCPSSISKKFWEIAVQNDLDKYCKTMLVDIIEGDDELKKYFRLAIGLLAIVFLPDFLSF